MENILTLKNCEINMFFLFVKMNIIVIMVNFRTPLKYAICKACLVSWLLPIVHILSLIHIDVYKRQVLGLELNSWMLGYELDTSMLYRTDIHYIMVGTWT